MSTKTLCAALLVVGVSGCARRYTAVGTESLDAAPATQSPAHDRDVISHDELQAPGVIGMSVLEAVRELRPRFLTVRGLNTLPAKDASGNPMTDDESGKVHSSIDGTRVGPLDDLSAIRASTIKEIRFLDVPAAHHKFGSASREGPVILVVVM